MPLDPENTGPLLVDRRRYPRIDAPSDLLLAVPSTANGEVIDISATGALLSTTVPLNVGDRARLSLLVGRDPVSAWVRVIRCDEGTRSGGTVRYHLGVAFVSVDDNSRKALAKFVRHEPGKP